MGEWLTVASNLKLTKINISSRDTHTCTHVCTHQNHKEKSTINTQSHFVCFLSLWNVPQKLTQTVTCYEKGRLRMSQKLFLWYQTCSLGGCVGGWGQLFRLVRRLVELLWHWRQHIVHFSKWIKRPIEPASAWLALESESIDGCVCCLVGIDVAVDVIPTS